VVRRAAPGPAAIENAVPFNPHPVAVAQGPHAVRTVRADLQPRRQADWTPAPQHASPVRHGEWWLHELRVLLPDVVKAPDAAPRRHHRPPPGPMASGPAMQAYAVAGGAAHGG
jgi:hypothetical protein